MLCHGTGLSFYLKRWLEIRTFTHIFERVVHKLRHVIFFINLFNILFFNKQFSIFYNKILETVFLKKFQTSF